MQDILNPTALDMVSWRMIQYMYDGKLGWLNIFLDRNGDWVCFDSNPKGDCENYLDVILNAVNGMLIGEEG